MSYLEIIWTWLFCFMPYAFSFTFDIFKLNKHTKPNFLFTFSSKHETKQEIQVALKLEKTTDLRCREVALSLNYVFFMLIEILFTQRNVLETDWKNMIPRKMRFTRANVQLRKSVVFLNSKHLYLQA